MNNSKPYKIIMVVDGVAVSIQCEKHHWQEVVDAYKENWLKSNVVLSFDNINLCFKPSAVSYMQLAHNSPTKSEQHSEAATRYFVERNKQLIEENKYKEFDD